MTTLDAATEVRNDTIHALEAVGHPDRVPPPRGRPVAARDRHALRRRARDGRLHGHVPADRQGGRGEGTATTRPSCRSRSSARTARACTRTCRSSRTGATSSSTPTTSTTCPRSAKAFIAGQLVHAREISAVFAQWVNSYKRLVPGYEAPVYVAWSQRNRSALIRIPLYKPGSEQATRAEIRCPDPACNPYLTFAALLHAGLEGIEKGYELPGTDGDEPLPPHRRRSGGSAGSCRCPRRSARRSTSSQAPSSCERRSARTSSTRYIELKRQRVGRVPRPAHRVGVRPHANAWERRPSGPRGVRALPRTSRATGTCGSTRVDAETDHAGAVDLSIARPAPAGGREKPPRRRARRDAGLCRTSGLDAADRRGSRRRRRGSPSLGGRLPGSRFRPIPAAEVSPWQLKFVGLRRRALQSTVDAPPVTSGSSPRRSPPSTRRSTCRRCSSSSRARSRTRSAPTRASSTSTTSARTSSCCARRTARASRS